MAYSYATYRGDGINRIFAVPFPYLMKAHVSLLVDGVVTPFLWLSAGSVSASSVPPEGALVMVQRATSRDKILTDFTDGSTLVESDLDVAILQSFYIVQEAIDVAEDTVAIASSAKAEVDDAVARSEAAVTSATEAGTKAEVAMTTATNAVGVLSASLATIQEAITKATDANTNATSAASEAHQAVLAAAAAATVAEEASKRVNEALGFDPTDYYKKVEIDAMVAPLATSSSVLSLNSAFQDYKTTVTASLATLSNAVEGKASAVHTHTSSDISDLATQLGSRVSKTQTVTSGGGLKVNGGPSATLAGDINLTLDPATNAEVIAGNEATKPVTPATLKAQRFEKKLANLTWLLPLTSGATISNPNDTTVDIYLVTDAAANGRTLTVNMWYPGGTPVAVYQQSAGSGYIMTANVRIPAGWNWNYVLTVGSLSAAWAMS